MLNKVTLIGNVGRDPECFGQQSKIAKFSLATSERSTVSGETREYTEWHTIVAYGKMAEVVVSYVRKGAKLYIEGKITTKQWDDPKSGRKAYRTEIELRDLRFLGSAPQTTAQASNTFGGDYINPEDLPY